MNRIALLALFAGFPACITIEVVPAPVVSLAQRADESASVMSLDQLARELAKVDVVFLGEDHGNTYGHWQQKRILELIHKRRSDVVLSMEMFERDVQSQLDAYLKGDIDEAEFLAESRPWPHYRLHYRPLVEFAKKHSLQVIAANVPRRLAKEVSYKGIDAAKQNPMAARSTTSPKDAYWTHFVETMRDHMGLDKGDDKHRADRLDMVYKFYQAQCLKDDTMAESITDYLQSVDGERPLVVHVVGQFHSNDRLGTVARVIERMPDLKVEIVRMETVPNVVLEDGCYVLQFVAPHYVEDMAERRTTEAKKIVAAKPTVSEEEAEDEPQGRPALGFMPGYETNVEGVLVSIVTEGGPAAVAGLEDGDVIVELDGEDIIDMESYMEILSSLTIGKKVKVIVDRDGVDKTFHVKVGQRGH